MAEYNLNNRSELYNIAKEVELNEDIAFILTAMTKAITNSKVKAAGLAAPQVGISKRVIILLTRGFPDIIINPVITRRRLWKAISKEGCLSFPGKVVKVKRDKQIIVEGFDIHTKPIKMKLRGFDAFVVQHEIDHLNGITIGGNSAKKN